MDIGGGLKVIGWGTRFQVTGFRVQGLGSNLLG
jgi:hypothetical protein